MRQIKPGKGKRVVVTVRSKATNKKVEDAQVTISGCGINESGDTDIKGKIIFQGVEPTETGVIQASVSKDGYEPDDSCSILVVP